MTPQSQQAIEALFETYPVHEYKKGHILLLSGDKIKMVHYLIEGRIKIYDTTYRGDELIVDTLKAPALYPLSLLLNNSSAAYIYEAESAIQLRQAPIATVRSFLEENPHIVLELLSLAYQEIDEILLRVVLTITGNAKSRLVYALIMECRKFGKYMPDGTWHLVVNERQLGSKAGLSRETVSREATILKRANLLEVRHNYVVIQNLTALEDYLATQT